MNQIKKTSILIILMMFLLLVNQVPIAFGIEKDYVKRQILTEIKWNVEDETIEAYYITALVNEDGLQVRDNLVTITDDSIDNENVGNVYDLVNKTERFKNSIYHADIIFGEWIDIYKDVSQEEVSKEELEDLTAELENQALKDYQNPPQIVNEDGGLIEFLGNYLYIIMAIGIVTYAFIWVRKNIGK